MLDGQRLNVGVVVVEQLFPHRWLVLVNNVVKVERLAVGGGKAEGGVADDVRLQVGTVSRYIAHTAAVAQQSEQAVAPLVL